VTAALAGAEHITVPYDEKVPVADAVKQHNSAHRFTLVLFSDTPLLRHAALLSAVAHAEKRNLPCVRLPRGYIFDNAKLGEAGDPDSLPALRYEGADEDFVTVSDYSRLSYAAAVMRRRIAEFHMSGGVNLIDPLTAYIDAGAVIAPGVTIYPNNTLRGAVKIGKGAVLRENNVIENSSVGEGAVIWSSVVEDSTVHAGARVGPYAHLRPGSVIGRHAKIGNYVEIKQSSIGSGAKVSHLTYIGDAVVEADCNIGCGVTVANYDGKKKHKTYIGEGAFIGSNSVLIAPVTVGARAMVAAGSVVTADVPPDALAIARARQENKPNYAKKFLGE
jgi:bifunctional UDP-N-acetylglucosamine pyrophosphorylase/glucosamine-1-phosphate N-acetyltransferase